MATAAAAGTEQGEDNRHKKGGGGTCSGSGGGGGGGSGGGGGEDGGSGGNGGGSDGSGGSRPPRALPLVPETDTISLEEALGLYEEDSLCTMGSHYTGRGEEGKEGPGVSCFAPADSGGGGQRSMGGEPGRGISGPSSMKGRDAEVRGTAGVDNSTSSSPAGNESTRKGGEKKEGEEGVYESGRKTVLDGLHERHALARLGGGKNRPMDSETDPLLPVYLGLYRNLSEAKGVPSGFKSRTTKSMDEGIKQGLSRAMTRPGILRGSSRAGSGGV